MSKGKKRQTMLSLEENLVEQAKALRINMSHLMTETLRHVLDTRVFLPSRSELILTEAAIRKLSVLIPETENELLMMKSQLREMEASRAGIIDIIYQEGRDTNVAGLFQQLKDVIKAHKYDKDEAYKDSIEILSKLSQYNITYDERTFGLLVDRLRSM